MFTLYRFPSTKYGTFGVFITGACAEFCTLEPVIVSYPEGNYFCDLYFSPKHQKELYRIHAGDPGSYYEFHAGNTIVDTEGCTLFGKGLGIVNGLFGVTDSVCAMTEFMAMMPPKFTLRVVNCK
jgi:hypothetical protein